MPINERFLEERDFKAQQNLRSSENYDAEAAARGEFNGDRWDGALDEYNLLD